jgi:hypothetical protein
MSCHNRLVLSIILLSWKEGHRVPSASQVCFKSLGQNEQYYCLQAIAMLVLREEQCV